MTIPFRYLGGRGHPELRRKVRSIKELDRKVKKVRLEKIDKNTGLKSRPLTLILRLFELYWKTGFNGWT